MFYEPASEAQEALMDFQKWRGALTIKLQMYVHTRIHVCSHFFRFLIQPAFSKSTTPHPMAGNDHTTHFCRQSRYHYIDRTGIHAARGQSFKGD
jgi:hypothetical protein